MAVVNALANSIAKRASDLTYASFVEREQMQLRVPLAIHLQRDSCPHVVRTSNFNPSICLLTVTPPLTPLSPRANFKLLGDIIDGRPSQRV
jgi:hypothetical protein